RLQSGAKASIFWDCLRGDATTDICRVRHGLPEEAHLIPRAEHMARVRSRRRVGTCLRACRATRPSGGIPAGDRAGQIRGAEAESTSTGDLAEGATTAAAARARAWCRRTPATGRARLCQCGR